MAISTATKPHSRVADWTKNVAAFALVEAIGLAFVVIAVDGISLANLPW